MHSWKHLAAPKLTYLGERVYLTVFRCRFSHVVDKLGYWSKRKWYGVDVCRRNDTRQFHDFGINNRVICGQQWIWRFNDKKYSNHSLLKSVVYRLIYIYIYWIKIMAPLLLKYEFIMGYFLCIGLLYEQVLIGQYDKISYFFIHCRTCYKNTI